MDLVADSDETPRAPAIQKPVPTVNPLTTLMRASSKPPSDLSSPSLRPSNTHAAEAPMTPTPVSTCTCGLAPSLALDGLGFEPVESIDNLKSKVGP